MAESVLQREIKTTRPFDQPEAEAILNILRTRAVLMEGLNRFFRKYGLTNAQFNILRILRGAGDPGLACQEISSRMVTPVPDVTRLVDRLVAAKHVTRRRSEGDRRVVYVRITPRGLALLAKMDKPLLDIQQELIGHMSRKDLDEINRLMAAARKADVQA